VITRSSSSRLRRRQHGVTLNDRRSPSVAFDSAPSSCSMRSIARSTPSSSSAILLIE
jgi:hypothetical protein